MCSAFPDDSLAAVELAAENASRYLEDLPGASGAPPFSVTEEGPAALFSGPLPDEGRGAPAAVRELAAHTFPAAVRSAGPRYFHFVTGGATPAALGADWLTGVLDQNAAAWICSPTATRAETVSLEWLKELFGLPSSWEGVMTTGGTMANFTALAAARRWWGERHGADVDTEGLAGLPRVPVFGSGFAHASIVKSLGMLGMGRGALQRFTLDGAGELDLEALRSALRESDGAPAILVATAGEPDAGRFDPIEAMADLAGEYGAWLHVDGAFGLFAGVLPELRHLVRGVERADSVSADGHKWLNVPFDTGFAFVHCRGLLRPVFTNQAAYLVDADDPHVNFANLGPDNSRRARAFAVWATLAAYGRSGYERLVAHHVELARTLARWVEEDPDLELLSPPELNVVCFRARPRGLPESRLDSLNERLGEELLRDGRVQLGGTVFAGCRALRPAIANWRTTEEDVRAILEAVHDLLGPLRGM